MRHELKRGRGVPIPSSGLRFVVLVRRLVGSKFPIPARQVFSVIAFAAE